MKSFAVVVMAGTLWLAASASGQAPGADNPASSQSSRMCDQDGDGKCDTCGREVGQGRGRGAGRGPMMQMRGGQGFAMRGGGMGPRNGRCMRTANQTPATPSEPAPKTGKQ